ncbi:hypothetical protein K661_02195 [Piscirickettsia salmonis LF-89 = ATCC VR-1361]|nr:hypothetical protein K661_02195 [Piscirickettsia salmonis LF-89 = ATCC VR-1361]
MFCKLLADVAKTWISDKICLHFNKQYCVYLLIFYILNIFYCF